MRDLVPQKDKFNEFFNDPPSCVRMCVTVCVCLQLEAWSGGVCMCVWGGGPLSFCTNTHIHISKSVAEFSTGEQCSDLVLEVSLSLFKFVEHTPRSQLFSLSLSLSLSSRWFIFPAAVSGKYCLNLVPGMYTDTVAAFLSLQASVDTPTHLPPPCLFYYCVCVCACVCVCVVISTYCIGFLLQQQLQVVHRGDGRVPHQVDQRRRERITLWRNIHKQLSHIFTVSLETSACYCDVCPESSGCYEI